MSDVMNTRQVDALLNRVSRALSPAEAVELLQRTGGRVGTMAESHVRESIPPAPGGRPLKPVYTLDGKPSIFKSKKQKGKVFALIGEGKIPTNRTGRLANSITHLVTIVSTGVIVTVGTNVGHGPVTLGDESQQSHYHAETGYVPMVETIDEHVFDYRDEVANSVYAFLQGVLRGS